MDLRLRIVKEGDRNGRARPGQQVTFHHVLYVATIETVEPRLVITYAEAGTASMAFSMLVQTLPTIVEAAVEREFDERYYS